MDYWSPFLIRIFASVFINETGLWFLYQYCAADECMRSTRGLLLEVFYSKMRGGGGG